MKTGIVLEGGACRGVFTSGVLDVMMEKGLRFDYCIGVSAGAGNAMNYKAGQHKRVYQITSGTDFKSYCGIKQVRKTGGSMLDLRMLYHTLSYEGDVPFRFADYYHNPMECEYVVTCCETGEAEYLHEEVYQRRLQDIVMASSSMPGVCLPVEVNGKHYLDGGVSDPLPVRRALEQGCDRVVLVTTKPTRNIHPTDYAKMRPILSKLYKDRYPRLFERMMNRKEQYFVHLEEVHSLERAGRIFVIRPEVCNIKSLEKDREKMEEYYFHGDAVCRKRWDALMEYLAEK